LRKTPFKKICPAFSKAGRRRLWFFSSPPEAADFQCGGSAVNILG
jgi:hypothetical protein